MLIVVEMSKICKVFRVIGLYISRKTFCLTLLWYYKERYDSGNGLFRLQIGEFLEYGGKQGVRIETFRYSWLWFKKTTLSVNETAG